MDILGNVYTQNTAFPPCEEDWQENAIYEYLVNTHAYIKWVKASNG